MFVLLGLLAYWGGRPAYDPLFTGLEVDDEAAIVAHLARQGVAPHGSAAINFGAEGDDPSLYFDDPDGNTVELKGPSA